MCAAAPHLRARTRRAHALRRRFRLAQAATNTLLSHLVSLIFTNFMLASVNKATSSAEATLRPAVVPPSGDDGKRPDTLGRNPWSLKAD
jgi:hypothetical protein